ncbi:hypothetical protein [Campylobacter peloridis]|uniref:hypothetical protein n=1 Tax=Campylobacter peloridis TaxID=488546 RepID=UPI001F333EC1|nr:hypothetical protein [Campylobacter peloridis]
MMVSKIFLVLKFLNEKNQAKGMQNINKIKQVIKESFIETKKGFQSIFCNTSNIIKAFSSFLT